MESYADILLSVKMSEIPFKKMNAFLAQIDIGLIKSFSRIKGIDVSTYFYTSGVRTTYPSGAVEFTPISCVELVFLNP
jgi:hypothetical protein